MVIRAGKSKGKQRCVSARESECEGECGAHGRWFGRRMLRCRANVLDDMYVPLSTTYMRVLSHACSVQQGHARAVVHLPREYPFYCPLQLLFHITNYIIHTSSTRDCQSASHHPPPPPMHRRFLRRAADAAAADSSDRLSSHSIPLALPCLALNEGDG